MAIQDQINRITNEVGTQSDLIEQIKSALYGKAVGNKQEQMKEIVITENGNYSIEPDEGYTLSGVDVNVATEDVMRKLFMHELTEYKIIETFEVGNKRIDCKPLRKLSMPNLKDTLAQYFLYGCTSLEYLDVGNISTFPPGAVSGLHKLSAIIMRGSSVVSLGGEFWNCNSITREDYTYYCYFYVPKALIEEYKAATNWSAYAHRFRAIEDYPEEVNYDNY